MSTGEGRAGGRAGCDALGWAPGLYREALRDIQ